MKKIMVLGLILVVAFFATTNSYAGAVFGTVVDSASGEPIVGAHVTLDYGTVGAITNIDDEYTILNIPAGEYYILADADYYYPSRAPQVKVTEEGRVRKDFSLGTDLVLDYQVVVIDTLWRSGKQIAFVVMESNFYRDRYHIHSSGIFPVDTMFRSVDIIQLPEKKYVNPREVIYIRIGAKLCFETDYLGRVVYDRQVTRFVQPIPEFRQLQKMVRDSLMTK